MLFALLVLISFALWFAASFPNSRVPEWPARLGFLCAALVWAWPVVAG